MSGTELSPPETIAYGSISRSNSTMSFSGSKDELSAASTRRRGVSWIPVGRSAYEFDNPGLTRVPPIYCRFEAPAPIAFLIAVTVNSVRYPMIFRAFASVFSIGNRLTPLIENLPARMR